MDITWNNLNRVLNDFADTFIERARENLTRNNTNASYDLYNSFEKIIEIGEDSFSVKISLEDYWYYVEHGRQPGRYPPPDVITRWIEVKPITIEPDMNGKTPTVEQVSFLISRKIAQEGTQPQPFFEPAKEETIREFEEAINQAIKDDVDEFIMRTVEEKMKDVFGK